MSAKEVRVRVLKIHHHHHHCLANMELEHLLTCSCFTHIDVSWTVSSGLFCLLVCNLYNPRQSITRYSVYILQQTALCNPVICPSV